MKEIKPVVYKQVGFIISRRVAFIVLLGKLQKMKRKFTVYLIKSKLLLHILIYLDLISVEFIVLKYSNVLCNYQDLLRISSLYLTYNLITNSDFLKECYMTCTGAFTKLPENSVFLRRNSKISQEH